MKLTQIEGKSPHKKGSAKYKKHMAAKHASMGEKVEAMKEIVERAKHVKANSKKPKTVKPNTGHESPHPYDNAGFVGEADLDEISMQDIKKNAKVAALTGAIGLGSVGLGNQIMNMDQKSYDYSIQLPQLEMYLDYAEAQKDQRMIKQLKTRIRNHKGRLIDMGDVAGPDGTPMSFEVVYDKENPDFEPLGDPMQLNKKFKDARDNKNEAKQPKKNNPVAKHSRNMPGAGAHKSPKDYDRKKTKQDLKKELDKSLNEGSMTFTDFVIQAKQSQKLNVIRDKELILKAYELFSKDVAKTPADAIDMARNTMDNMAFEGKYSADKTTLVKAVISSLEKKAMDGDIEDIKFLRRLASLVDKKVYKRENGALTLEDKIPFTQCPNCRGDIVHESELIEAKKKKKKKKQDACYHKVKSRYKVWPSAYASGALVQCRKKGAKNWGNKSKKK